MTQSKGKKCLQDLQSVNRITHIPIVETSLNVAEGFYNRVKKSNGLITVALDQMEITLTTVLDNTVPQAMQILHTPLDSVDKILCKSLDFVEDKIPSINLPPQMIYWNTKEYARNTIVRPVLNRADSVKQLGNTVLASKYTEYAANRLDGALNVADRYVDKYLPGDENEAPTQNNTQNDSGKPSSKAINTIQHADRLGKKLKRRLTKRTLAEVKALKEHSAEAVHVLIYAAELIATDPKLALEKAKELWMVLSRDEPENQARPENVEQLIVLVTRESARRVVHLVNYAAKLVSLGDLPKRVTRNMYGLLNDVYGLVKSLQLEAKQKYLVQSSKAKIQQIAKILRQFNIKLSDLLEQLVHNLDNPELEKPSQTQGKNPLLLQLPNIKVTTENNYRPLFQGENGNGHGQKQQQSGEDATD